MQLNEKHLKIIESLMKEEIESEKLSYLLNLSEKTISNYIRQINGEFEKESYITKHHHLLSLVIKDNDSFFDKLNLLKQQCEEIEKENLQRKDELFYHLSIHKQTTLDEMAVRLFLSKALVSKILKDIKRDIEAYHVQITGTPNVGLVLEGSEFEIRKLAIEQFPSKFLEYEVPQRLITGLCDLQNDWRLDEQSFERLLLSLKVTLHRMDEGHFIDGTVDLDTNIFNSQEYVALNFMKAYLEMHFPETDARKEIILIVIQLMGRRASILDELLTQKDERLIQKIIDQTIQDVERFYGLKIDETLFTKDIRLHIKHLINRLIFRIKLNNELTYDMKQRFPFAYELSTVLGESITRVTGLRMPEKELGFLTIYFSVYLEQLEQKMNELRDIAILTNQGLSTTKLLTMNLHKVFGTQINVVVLDDSEFTEERIQPFDLVLSTVKTNRMFNKVIYVEDVFDQQLLKLKIEQFLIYKDVNNKKFFNRSVLVDFLDHSDFYHFQGQQSYQNIICRLADELYEEGKVDDDFKKNIIDRENKKSTINGPLGFPHASHKQEGIFIKVGVLDEPPEDHENVKIVVLIASPEANVNEAMLIRIYEEVLAITTNNYILKKIHAKTTYTEFCQILNQEMRE
ncbi:BglG family transcription antiterminator [Virgibacillus senegalensis]|uniref:BglG family transcription antiterminator n=1 Tax=Virgibacillus senegalensis TaxID=1499679 RepID=UPI00069DD713|nr:PRD domain-containing protein [Virgibacillus senegalensis]